MRKSDSNSESKLRKGERVLRKGDKWFYRTREGLRGPFESEVQMHADMMSFVGTMEFIEDNAAELPGHIDHEDVTFVEMEPPAF